MSEEEKLEPPELSGAPWHPLHLPWPLPDAPPQGAAPRVRWHRMDRRLFWQMESPLPQAGRPAFPGPGFAEGLWEQDLAECFLLDCQTGHYTEYNLSPGGAWWAAHFTAPRVRRDPQPVPDSFGVRLAARWKDQGWTGWMEIPLPSSGRFGFNFTAIVQTPQGCCYYSLALLGGSRPDYHRPQEWCEWV